jgi:hypothetical protein
MNNREAVSGRPACRGALQEGVEQTNAATGELEAEERVMEGDLLRVRREGAVRLSWRL